MHLTKYCLQQSGCYLAVDCENVMTRLNDVIWNELFETEARPRCHLCTDGLLLLWALWQWHAWCLWRRPTHSWCSGYSSSTARHQHLMAWYAATLQHMIRYYNTIDQFNLACKPKKTILNKTETSKMEQVLLYKKSKIRQLVDKLKAGK